MNVHRRVICAAALVAAFMGVDACKARPQFLTVDAHCHTFCNAFCGHCAPGVAACPANCLPACYHGRDPGMLLDGTNPTVAMAKTQADDDACAAAVATSDCTGYATGQVPPVCYSWPR